MIVPPELILHIAKWCDIDTRNGLASALGWNCEEFIKKLDPGALCGLDDIFKRHLSFARLHSFARAYWLRFELRVCGRVNPIRITVSIPSQGSKMECLDIQVRQKQGQGVWTKFATRGMKEGKGWKWTYERLDTGPARWFLQNNQKRQQLQHCITGLI
jgi:hypothetical protein